MSDKRLIGVAIFVIIVIGLLFNYQYIFEFPSHIHAWAQADRYALSLGFLNNNLNFFKPETFVLNHQFPHRWEVPSETSITAVDFPIHDYVPALLMKVTGVTSPFIFRLYVLLYSFAGLFALYKLSYLLTKSFFKSILVVVFAATSPVFVYYQSGFLPTIPSLSNAIIAIYFYTRYIYSNQNKDFRISIFFITLSALSRTTFAIPLIALSILELLRVFEGQAILKPKLLSLLSSFAIILGYYLYNNSLREKYGSEFLNYILPPNSFSHGVELITNALQNWGFQYFTIVHYSVIIGLLITIGFLSRSTRLWLKKEHLTIGLLTLIIFAGCVSFAALMLRQFPAHDYYFLDTFFLPIILSVILLCAVLPSFEIKIPKTLITGTFTIAVLVMAIKTLQVNNLRHKTQPWDRISKTAKNYQNSAEFLDSLGIPKDAKILAIDAYAPNIPLALMNRKGYVVMNTSKDNLLKALAWDYDFITIQNEFFFSEVFSEYPEILSKISKIGGNDKITVCTLSETTTVNDIFTFYGLEKKDPVFHANLSFESPAEGHWQNIRKTSDLSFTGKLAGLLEPEDLYGLTYKTKKFLEINTAPRILHLSSAFYKPNSANCEIVVTISGSEGLLFHQSYNIKNLMKHQNKWEKIDLFFHLPKVDSKNHEFALFLNNPEKARLYLDDFTFSLY